MALAFVGIDPDTKNGGSPTVWTDSDTREVVIQGWKADQALRQRMAAALAPQRGAGLSEVEDVIRVPVRLVPVLRKACGMPAFVGASRQAKGDGSPTAWVDEATREIVIRGWRADAALRAQVTATPAPDHEPGIPEGEDVVRVPAHQVEALREACDAADRLG